MSADLRKIPEPIHENMKLTPYEKPAVRNWNHEKNIPILWPAPH